MRRLQNWPGLNHGWEAKCSIPLLVLLVNDSEYCDRDRQQYNKNPAKDFCWWDIRWCLSLSSLSLSCSGRWLVGPFRTSNKLFLFD